MMKKLLILPVFLASVFTFAGSAQAAANSSATTASAAGAPQIFRVRRNNRGRMVRTYTTTRIERRGDRVFRVTYQITERPNGRIIRRQISRVRIR